MSVALGNAWVKDSRSFLSAVYSRVFSHLAMRHTRVFFFVCGDPKQWLHGSLTMLVLALRQIYKSVFHLWKSTDLNSAWVRYSFRSQFSFLPRVLACLEMRHTRILGAGISTNASPNFLKILLLALPKSTHVYFTCGRLSIRTVLV